MKTLRIPLRVVFYKDEDQWIAHCLEFDLCGDEDTKEVAVRSLTTAIQIQVEDSLAHNNPKNLFTPADGEVFEKFFAGKDTVSGELKLTFDGLDFQGTEYREYSEDLAGAGRGFVSA